MNRCASLWNPKKGGRESELINVGLNEWWTFDALDSWTRNNLQRHLELHNFTIDKMISMRIKLSNHNDCEFNNTFFKSSYLTPLIHCTATTS